MSRPRKKKGKKRKTKGGERKVCREREIVHVIDRERYVDRKREKESVCVCVCVFEREWGRDRKCVCACMRERSNMLQKKVISGYITHFNCQVHSSAAGFGEKSSSFTLSLKIILKFCIKFPDLGLTSRKTFKANFSHSFNLFDIVLHWVCRRCQNMRRISAVAQRKIWSHNCRLHYPWPVRSPASSPISCPTPSGSGIVEAA